MQKAANEAPPEHLIELTPSMKKLTSELEKEIKAGKVKVISSPGGW